MVRLIRLTESDLHNIIKESVSKIISEIKGQNKKSINEAYDEHMFDGVEYINPGEVKYIIRNIVGNIRSNTPFKAIHQLVKSLDASRNHVAGRGMILNLIKKKVPDFDVYLRNLNTAYANIIELAKSNYGGFQKLDEFNMNLMDIYKVVMVLAKAIKESGAVDPGSSITAINGGNSGKDVGLARIVGDAQWSLAKISNIMGKVEDIIKNGKDPMSYNDRYRR